MYYDRVLKTIFFPRAKNNFAAGLKGQVTPHNAIFESQCPVSAIFNNALPEMTNYHSVVLK
jgi:hypothetical protein